MEIMAAEASTWSEKVPKGTGTPNILTAVILPIAPGSSTVKAAGMPIGKLK